MSKLIKQVAAAISDKVEVHISGNNSKAFLADSDYAGSNNISLAEHSGIIDYQPDELFIVVKAGTSLTEINTTLAANNQFLGFMPPDYGNSTIGGTVACGLSGSSRPYLGAMRDHLLGLKLINGKAQELNFGGQMIKNVAGFDVTRLLCGSKGKLGIISEISLKTLPLTEQDKTIKVKCTITEALAKMNELGLSNDPLHSAAFMDGFAYYRLAGFAAEIKNSINRIGGDEEDKKIWNKFNPFKVDLKPDEYLWRVTCGLDTKVTKNTIALDWGGMRRWLITDSNQDPLPNGMSVLWQGMPKAVYAKKPKLIEKLEHKIKYAFDPQGVFV